MVSTTWMEVDLEKFKANVINIKSSLSQNMKVCGVVKANAYGHGAVEIAKTLELEGIDYLAVARLEEAIEIRRSGVKAPILCLGYVNKSNFKIAVENNVTMTIYSLDVASEYNKVCGQLKKIGKVHIKVDTGMGRLGFESSEKGLKDILEVLKLKNIHVEGIYTHFSKADEEDKQYTELQLERFKYVLKGIEKLGIDLELKHASNSAGIIDQKGTDFNMVRAGIIMYGHYPSDEVEKAAIKVNPVMTLKTRVAQIKKVTGGERIGYGGKYKIEEDTYIATIPIGYADGFMRGQKSPQVMIKGNVYDVVGRICMDQCMVDIGSNKDGIEFDDEVIVFGEDNLIMIEEVAEDLGTISYELMCAISKRVERIYKKN